MEDIIKEEFLAMADELRSKIGQDVETKQLFNLYVMNVLWNMMTGSRCELVLLSVKFENKTQPLIVFIISLDSI